MHHRRRGPWAAIALVLASAVPASARTFADILGTPITRPISDAFAKSVGRALPVIAASPGVSFTFDPASGAFVREPAVLGQLFLERAQPLGRRRWNVNFSYQWVRIDSFEGEDVHHLSDANIRDRNTGNAVSFPLFGIDLDTHAFTGNVTYGVTDDLDVNLTVPLLLSDFRLRILQQSPGTPDMSFDESSSKVGVGDVFLRAKYRVLSRDQLQAALGLVLRLPAGEEENFQGTGRTEVAPMIYASSRAYAPVPPIRLQGYVNAGVNFDTKDVSDSEARWGLGLDCGVYERVTLAAAVLARNAFSRIAPAGFFSVPHTDGSERPLFGIRGERPDLYDFSFGGRVSLWRDTIFGFANAIVPLNEDGVRADVIPTAGIEASF